MLYKCSHGSSSFCNQEQLEEYSQQHPLPRLDRLFSMHPFTTKYLHLFVCLLFGACFSLTSWTFCLYLFSSTFFVPTPHPSFQGAGYMWPGWMAVSSALSSTPFGFTECLTHCPVSNTCTRIIPNPPLLYPTPKAISLQRGSSTTTATPPHPTMGTQAHRHSDPTPIFFFLTLSKNHSNVLVGMFEGCIWWVLLRCGLLRNTMPLALSTLTPIKFPKRLSRNKWAIWNERGGGESKHWGRGA